MKHKVLLVINGESFRVGPQMSRLRDFNQLGLKCQLLCTLSHLRFIDNIKNKHGLDSDVFLSTYKLSDEVDSKLISWYGDKIINMNFYDKLFNTEGDFINQTIKDLSNLDLDEYEYIIFARIDYYLKKTFNNEFYLEKDKIMFSFFDVHLGSNFVCHGFFVVPNKYFFYLLNHKIWDHHSSYKNVINNIGNISDCYYRSHHLCCSSGDWNPLFSYPARQECLVYPGVLEKINNYMNLEFYKELYSDIIGKDTIEENFLKIDIEKSIDYNLDKIK